MDGSRIKKYEARQLFPWAVVALSLLFLGVQLFVFGGDGVASPKTPGEVRAAQEKLRALAAARQALARPGPVNLTAIPDRDYAAGDPATLVVEAALPADVEDLESYSPTSLYEVTPAEVEVLPILKGIVQTRDASGQLRLRAAYPRRIVSAGESVAGYLVQQITVESVTLSKNGKVSMQQVANSRLTRRQGE